MIHHGKCLPLRLESRDDLLCIQSRLDDLECDSSPNRMLLLGDVDKPESPLADLLLQLVKADHGAGAFDQRWRVARSLKAAARIIVRLDVENTTGVTIRCE